MSDEPALDYFYKEVFGDDFEAVEELVDDFKELQGFSKISDIYYQILNSEEIKSFVGIYNTYELPYVASMEAPLIGLGVALAESLNGSTKRGSLVKRLMPFLYSPELRQKFLYEILLESVSETLQEFNNASLLQIYRKFLVDETYPEFMDTLRFETALDENVQLFYNLMMHHSILPAFNEYLKQKQLKFETTEFKIYQSFERMPFPQSDIEFVEQINFIVNAVDSAYKEQNQENPSELESIVYDSLKTAFKNLKQNPHLKKILAQEIVDDEIMYTLISDAYSQI